MRIRDDDITPQQQLKCGINKKRARDRVKERKRDRERKKGTLTDRER